LEVSDVGKYRTNVKIVAAVTVATISLLVTACGGPRPTDKPGDSVALESNMVVTTTTGTAGKAISTADKKFTQKTGVTIQYIEGNTSANFAKIQAQAANPQIDIMRNTMDTFLEGVSRNLWTPIDPAQASNYAAYPEKAKLAKRLGVVTSQGPPLIFYNQAKFKEQNLAPPRDFSDLLSEPKLRGHVAFPHISNGYMRAYLAMRTEQLGGSAADPTPALKEIAAKGKDWVYQYPATPAEMVQLETSGQVWAGVDGLVSIDSSAAAGLPLKFVAPPVIPSNPIVYSIVANAPHPRAAQAFMNWLLGAESQRLYMEGTYYVSILPVEVSEAVRSKVLTTEESKRIRDWDFKAASANTDRWQTAWARYILS
jgi:putative spermidine/putrescine transport system substrate-binding protein